VVYPLLLEVCSRCERDPSGDERNAHKEEGASLLKRGKDKRIFRYLVPIGASMVLGFAAVASWHMVEKSRVGQGVVDEIGGAGARSGIEGPAGLSEGEYLNPVYTKPGALTRGREAELEESNRTAVRGWYEGYYFVTEANHLGADAPQSACAPAERRLVEDGDELRSSDLWFDLPRDVPPGAFRSEPAKGSSCEGRILAVQQTIDFRPSGGRVGFLKQRGPGSRLVYLTASAGRFHKGVIGERDALIVDPLTAEGYGIGTVLFDEGPGKSVLIISSRDVPLSDLVMLAAQVF
jgi:hypothetical protein